MELDSLGKQALERVDAVLRMPADKTRADRRVDRMKRHPQRREVHIDYTLLFLGSHVRERDEGAA